MYRGVGVRLMGDFDRLEAELKASEDRLEAKLQASEERSKIYREQILEKLIEIQATQDKRYQIVVEVEKGLARVISHLESEHIDRANFSKVLHGNGKPGLLVRVDRLEQIEKGRAKILIPGALTLVGLAIKAIWDLITSPKGP